MGARCLTLVNFRIYLYVFMSKYSGSFAVCSGELKIQDFLTTAK